MASVNDWDEAVEVQKNFSDDALEIRNKLQNWITGKNSSGVTIDEVDFSFSDGTTETLKTIDEIKNTFYGDDSPVAGENLSQGDLVKYYDDGGTTKVKKLQVSSFTSGTQYSASSNNSAGVCYDSDNDVYTVFYDKSGDGDLYGAIATMDANGDLSYNSESEIEDLITVKVRSIKAFYSSTSNVMVVFYIDTTSNDTLKYAVMDNDGTNITNINSGNAINSGIVQDYDVCYDSVNDTFGVLYYDDTGVADLLRLGIYSPSGTSNMTQSGTAHTIETSADYGIDDFIGYKVGVDTDNKIYHTFYTYDDNGSYDIKARAWDEDVGSFDSIVDLKSSSTYGMKYLGVDYNSNDGSIHCVGIYENNDIVYHYKYEYDTNIDTYVEYYNRNIFSQGLVIPYGISVGVYFDFINSKIVINSEWNFFGEFSINVDETFLVDYNTFSPSEAFHPDIAFDSGNNVYVFVGSTNGNAYTKFIDGREKFVGIIQSDVSSGNTASVATVNSTTESISGLTPGNKYYIAKDISLTTNKNAYPVGLAISSSKMKLL